MWDNEHRRAVKKLTDERRSTYDDLRALGGEPVRVDFMRPDVRIEAGVVGGKQVATRERHLLGDSLPKLRGLAAFAAEFGEEFHRIEAITEIDGTRRVLDLTEARVRQVVADADDAGALYLGSAAADY